MKYRIKEVRYEDQEVYFFPQRAKGWFSPWYNIGYSKFLTLEDAKKALDEEVRRMEREERLRNPPTRYHNYK